MTPIVCYQENKKMYVIITLGRKAGGTAVMLPCDIAMPMLGYLDYNGDVAQKMRIF